MPKTEEVENQRKEIIKEIMARNSPNFLTNIRQIQEAHKTTSNVNTANQTQTNLQSTNKQKNK